MQRMKPTKRQAALAATLSSAKWVLMAALTLTALLLRLSAKAMIAMVTKPYISDDGAVRGYRKGL